MAAKADRVLLALDKANCQLAKHLANGAKQEHSEPLFVICSRVAAALPLDARSASFTDSEAATFLVRHGAEKLTRFLRDTLRAVVDCMHANDEV
jgi:class 3 adenylate cyclase